jgi:ParB/RepB/Spo0J family partition protein
MRTVHELAVADVKIRSPRQRSELGDVAGLAESINKWGLLHPIVLDRSNQLIAGERRLRACELLKRPTIEALYRDELDEVDLEEMELEENVRRKQLSWPEEQRAIARIHQLRVARDPQWGQQQTKELTGIPRQATISEALHLTKMLEVFPELAEAKTKNQALSWMKAKAKSIVRMVEVRDNRIDYSDIESKLWLGDSVELIKRLPDEQFHAIITDPPFGLDYDKRTEGEIGTLTSYEDSPQSYERLLTMCPDLYRTLKPSGWVIWFLGISWYEKAKLAFRDAGFVVDELPIIWDRSEGRCFTTRPDRYFGRAYDIALHCIKGDPQICPSYRSKPNIIRIAPVSNSERETLVERPVELYEELIKRLTYPGECVADFFVGSGSCLAAASKLERDYFGIEQDAERRAYAITKIKAYTPQRQRVVEGPVG